MFAFCYNLFNTASSAVPQISVSKRCWHPKHLTSSHLKLGQMSRYVASDLNLSWPAVSHSCSLTRVPSRTWTKGRRQTDQIRMGSGFNWLSESESEASNVKWLANETKILDFYFLQNKELNRSHCRCLRWNICWYRYRIKLFFFIPKQIVQL